MNSRPRLDLSPRSKIILTLGLVVICVSTPAHRFPAFAGYLLFLAAFAWLIRAPLYRVLRRSLAVLPFVLMIALFIPFLPENAPAGSASLGPAGAGAFGISHYKLLVLWNTLAKAWTGAFALVILSASTPFPDLLHGLDHLRFPRLLLTLLAVTHRYGLVFAEELGRTRRALEARAFRPRWLWQAGVIGRLIGSFFLRSYERGERVYLAMLARGFTGVFPVSAHVSHSRDVIFLAISFLVLAAIRWGIA